jgi:mono/diheme cytochrome c family protein
MANSSGALNQHPQPNLPGVSDSGRSWTNLRLLVGGVLLGVVGAAAIGAIVVGPVALGHRQDLPLETKYGSYAVSVAARLGSATVGSPPATSGRGLATGRAAYTGSCGSCHGANGDGKGAFGQATYPPATSLTSENAKEKSDAELFWITKNGLSFTAMPGFGSQYDDQTIWQTVQYIRALQNGTQTGVEVPAPTMAELQVANPLGTPAQRGAAVYFAQGCQYCHGAVGKAPAGLGLHGNGGESTRAIRQGRRGMPAYGADVITDADLADLQAYMGTFDSSGGFGGDD